MTMIYLAGAEVETLTRALLDNGVTRILYSFFYIHTMRRYSFIRQIQEEYPHVLWFLDSGAYTYYQKFRIDPGKLPPLKSYKKLYYGYIKSTWQRWSRITELDMDDMFEDITLDLITDWRNELVDMLPDGAPVMPVWHQSRGPEEWSWYCRDPRYRYLAIGSGAPVTGRHAKMVKEAHKFSKLVHGFGMTRVKTALPYIPYDSVDSTSWVMGQKFGTSYIFANNTFTVLDKTQKAKRREFRRYYENIGCDWDLISQDDVAEIRKANIIAWRNMGMRLEHIRSIKKRTLNGFDVNKLPFRNREVGLAFETRERDDDDVSKYPLERGEDDE